MSECRVDSGGRSLARMGAVDACSCVPGVGDILPVERSMRQQIWRSDG